MADPLARAAVELLALRDSEDEALIRLKVEALEREFRALKDYTKSCDLDNFRREGA